MRYLKLLSLLLAFVGPVAAKAAGGHESVGCTGCHSLHTAKGEMIFAVTPNTKYLNPKTKQPFQGVTALCLACHADADKGGQGFAPVSQHTSHPFFVTAINSRVAHVPPELLRDNGRFDCLGCHDPHPSNPNYKYLRVGVGAKGEKIDAFCSVCHGAKTDQASAKQAIFSSMDENRPLTAPVAAPAAPAAAKPAAAPKK